MVPDTAESAFSTNSDLTRPAAPVNVLEVSPQNMIILRVVRTTMAKSLQEHAIPSCWWLVDSLPLTASGKTDKMRLQAWVEKLDGGLYSEYQNGIFTRSSLVGAVAISHDVQFLQSLWARVLNRPVEGIDPASSFVEMGADSLDIIRLVSEARKSGLALTYTQIYTARSIEQLVLRRKEQTSHSEAEIEDIYPCTPYQSSLMILDLKHPGSYLCIFDWTLAQNVDIERLKAAWNTLIADEPVLRNRLIWNADAQEIWQVTVQYREGSVDWTKNTFDLPMALGSDLCRACIQWEDEVHRWRYSIKIHHSIVDGWSLRLMLNRFKSTYFGEAQHQPSAAPFSHYVSRLIKRNRQHQVTSQRFWQGSLDEFSPPDFPPPLSGPHYEVHSTVHTATSIAINLQDTASGFGITPATLLYGTAGLVLGAHSRSKDIVFGLILAGRDTGLSGIGDMIGPAFAVVPFRNHIDRHATLKDHFEGIERRVIDIIPHQHYGLQQIKNCGPGAKAACDFGCLIVVQPEDEMLAGAGLWEEALGQTSGLADNIPLSFELILAEEHVLIKSNYDPAIVQAEVVTTILGHLKCALQDLSSKGRQDLVRDIRFDEQDEVSRMLAWTREYGDPVNRCLHELFIDAFKEHPECIAIDDEATQQQYTHHQLDMLTSGLSAFLCSKHGICAGTVVPVAMEKSALAVMVMLAILRAGAAYVPIDPEWPLERTRYIISDTRASFILCSHLGGTRYSGLASKVIEIGENSWQDSVVAAAEKSVRPTDLALIMYTSGSTGRPKGVMLEHGALSTSLTHLAKAFGLSRGMRHLQFSSFVYDVSIADIFIPLMTGARICIPSEESCRNHLSTTIREMAIESATLTPSVVELLDLDECASLKTIITGGEMPKSSMIRTWSPRVQLLNAYGPTEASITTTVGTGQAVDGDPSNIGRNVTGWDWIVGQDDDGSMYPVPRGCVGEIVVAGHCLARGYLSNDALTAESFVEAPHLTPGLPSNRVYRTGDLGRYARDGTLRIIGRKDRLVKINGIRIDPGEPEFQLRQLGGIFTSCVVDCVGDAQGHPRLVVFIPSPTSADGKNPAFRVTCQQTRGKLAEILPPRMIPTLFFPVQSIPRTASDKRVHNAHALFGVGQDEIEHEPSGRAPATLAEEAVEAALRGVFSRGEPLTTAADFFLLGGDSLLAIRLVGALKKSGFTVTVHDVYTHLDIESLARVAKPLDSTTPTRAPQKTRTTSHVSSLVVSDALRAEVLEASQLSSASIDELYPASPFQEGLAAISQQEHASSDLYSATMAFQLAAGHEVARLHQAVEWVVAQNPIWRTKLVHTSHGTMQAVQRPQSINEIHDEGRSSFFRWWIVSVDNSLMLRAHHALYDAWTIKHLLEDVNYNYRHPKGMRPGRAPYRQFIERLSTVDQDAARTFWANQLREAFLCQYPSLPPCSRPPRATSCTNDTAHVDFQGFREMKISPATVVATAMALALSAHCYSDDVCYGITLSGRDQPELGNIAGPTLSTVPMRLRLCRDHSLHSLLHETQSLLFDMRQHQHLALHEMARFPVQDVQDALRFRTLLVIQHDSAEPGLEQDYAVVQRMIPEKSRMHVNYPFVLVVDIDQFNHKLHMRLEYDPECLDDSQARRFLQHLRRVVTQCSLPTRLVGDVELLTDVDLTNMAGWNRPSTRTDAPTHLHHTFSRLAAAQPGKPAIDSCCPEPFFFKRLSYRELDNLATRLSESIRSLAPHALFIGLCLSKSPLAIVAMLATWKAGRTFVTLDPSAPSKRTSTVLREFSSAIVVLTEPAMVPLLPDTTLLVLDTSSSTMHLNLLDRALQSPDPPTEAINAASHNAYVMFTSGTSGTPKGVMVSHGAIARSVKGYASSVCLKSDARMLQFAAFTFDTCILEIFATLTTGGCLCIPSDPQRFGGGLVHALQSMRVNQLIVTPTVAQLTPPEEVSFVQGVMLVGEPPSPSLIDKWTSRMPSVRVMNGYGPTEAAVHASTNFDLSTGEACNIGYPSAGQLFITVPGRIDKLAAVGTIGELIVCGDSLAEGYLNKPDLTAQAFGTSLPWMSNSKRYYRTGDLARYSNDGSIVYLGRRDLQVKLRGQRIELQEVQWQVIQHGRFSGCVVDILPSDLLVAYLVPENSSHEPYTGPLPPNTFPRDILSALRSHLSSALPTFMIPAVYIPISRVPQTASGKVDRRRLRDSVEAVVDDYRVRGTQVYERATTKEEKLLSKIWAQTLAIPEDQIAIHDNISLLGGDSVTVIRIMAAARKCGLHLPMTGAYLNSTLKTMASAALTTGKHTTKIATPPAPFSLVRGASTSAMIAMAARKCSIGPELVQDLYPCTDMQEGLMISSAMSPGAYFNQEVYTVASSTCKQQLRSSIQDVWRRHPILRTQIFLDQNSQGVQTVVDEDPEILTLEGEDFQEFLCGEAKRCPTYGEKLCRVTIIRSERATHLVFSRHHAIFDGWSQSLFLEDIEREYHRRAAPITTQQHFSPFLRYVLEIQESPEGTEFRQHHLAGSNATRIPQISTSAAFEVNQRSTLKVPLPSHGKYSLSTTAEAAWALLLARYAQTDDVCFGTIRSGRTCPVDCIETMLGPTISAIPRRLRPISQTSVQEYLAKVQSQTEEALAWELFGRRKIRTLGSGPEQACKFNSMLVVQMMSRSETEHRLLTPKPESAKVYTRGDCLLIECQPQDHQLAISVSYDNHLVSPGQIRVLSMNPTEIGLDSDFSGLGGESLAAIRLASLCREIGFAVDVGTVLKTSGLEQMADRIERHRQSSNINDTVQDSNRSCISYDTTQVSQIAAACKLDNADIEDVYPSTPTQEALMAVTMRLPQAYILIWDDLNYAYSNLASPPARPPYREYIHFLCAQDKNRDLAFWRDSLDGFQGKHYPPLPSTDYICQAASDTSRTLVNAVKWNNECRFTFATVARAAWGLVLAIHDRGHASSKDICFASTSSGRTVPVKHVDQVTGPTIGTVPMRLKFELEQPIDQYLAQVQDQTTATLAYEHYGMHQIRKIGSAERAACSTTNLLVIQAAESSSADELPLGLEPVDVEDQRFVEPYGLIMVCMHSQSRDTISLSISYDIELLTKQEATNALHQTSWMIAQLNYRCSEREPIRNLLWSLADNAHDGLLNYDDLEAAAEALASSLRAQYNVKPGHHVPLCFEKSCAMIVAILGILKAGAGYVPLDIGCPQARLDHMVQETAARVVLISPLLAKGKAFSVPTLVYDRNHSPTRSASPQHAARPQDIAYVTFTSGSTGQPKGVITEHGSARLSILEHCKRYQHSRHGPDLRTLQYSSYAIDASVLDIFATFAQGGCLCLPSEDDRLGNVQDFMRNKQVNFADLTPTLAILLDLGKLPQLRVMAIGDEMASRSLITKLTDSGSSLEYIVNSYGPTEAAIGCAAGEITPKSVPGYVGKQVGGSLWIVDETNHDHLLPVSCRGELAVSGPTLARGYLNAEQLTRQAFIESAPWLAKVGETRFYKTGDLACIGMDGTVEILGRKEEEQIKLHGVRVELGEIEAIMRGCPSLANTPHLSAAKIDLSGTAAIVAFVCTSDPRSASASNVLSPPSSEFQAVVEQALCAMR
ncbi:MAG: hypothetical protein LQ350_008135 [Teloschistes chrysophthalmus]|nr:MAG: hypothetical protein LQ350_008135 [Niorma chrysophthalma]